MKNSATTFEDRLDSLKERMRHLVDVSGERASAIRDRMTEVKATVVAGSKTGVQRMGTLIKQHPFIAVGIAFGVGYLAIRMARR